MLEIERKFLVKSEEFRQQATSRKHLIQGFLSTDPDRTVRVRVTDDAAYLTIKGKSSASGMSRFEWEHQIPLADGRILLELCEQPLIEKYRYVVPVGKYTFEVDEFLGTNGGLLLAEVELQQEEDPVLKPAWLGKEVTGQKEYYNSQLSKKPYSTWNLEEH
jgi:adenylate cyclase